MLHLRQIGKYKWIFIHPEGYEGTLDELDRGCDLYEIGDFIEAEKVFKTIVEKMPDHLDALHHWALVREKSGDLIKAKELWGKAVSIGRKTFPESFEAGRDRLIWGVLDNRPYLRCLHGLGLVTLNTGGIKKANEIFMDMLKLNPNDNQGARANAVESFFYLDQPEKVLEICDSYPYDGLPDTLYGRALAYLQLGDKKKAVESLKHAIKHLPRVAKEIIKEKHKKPKFMHPYRITVGGKDEAYEYWQRNGIHWKNTVGSIEWVGGVLGKDKKAKSKDTVVYQFKITLKHIKPLIWRRFLVTSHMTLYRFHIVLLEIMGWSGGHLHSFTIDDRYYGTPDPEFDSFHETINEKKVKLKDIIHSEKQKFSFEYDFGDGWIHELIIEKILPFEEKIHYPVCLKGARACPPEDCGGPYGYIDFLNAIHDPNHPEHESQLEWIGGSFDPEEFNLEETNELLKGVNKRKPLFEDFI